MTIVTRPQPSAWVIRFMIMAALLRCSRGDASDRASAVVPRRVWMRGRERARAPGPRFSGAFFVSARDVCWCDESTVRVAGQRPGQSPFAPNPQRAQEIPYLGN